ncbi:MAG: ABC transporter ATP-binding protein [Bacillota bacterium]|nr:ABC transporter ATP-binding protein [Bacillota bacterium]
MSILSIENINHAYHSESDRKTNVLNSLSFQVDENGIYTIHGKSGSGKSTLLKIMGGMLRPTSGKILFENTDIWSLSERALTAYRANSIGFVFQEYALIPELTVEQNILLPLHFLRREVNSAVYHDLIERLELKDRLRYYPNQISGGEKQRTSIARALIKQPSVILADEPTGNLDQELSAEVMNYFSDSVRYMGCTSIVVTHDEAWQSVSDKVFHLVNGKLILR